MNNWNLWLFEITADWFNVDFTSNKTENTWMSLHNLLSIVLLLPICGKFLIRNSTVQFWLMCWNEMSFKIKSRYNGLKFHNVINHPAAYFMIIMHLISNSKQHRHMSAVYTSCKWLNFNFSEIFSLTLNLFLFLSRDACWSKIGRAANLLNNVEVAVITAIAEFSRRVAFQKRQYRLISCAKAV